MIASLATAVGIGGMAGAYHAIFVSRATRSWIRTIESWTGVQSDLGVNLVVFGVPVIIAMYGIVSLGIIGAMAVYARLSPVGKRIMMMVGFGLGIVGAVAGVFLQMRPAASRSAGVGSWPTQRQKNAMESVDSFVAAYGDALLLVGVVAIIVALVVIAIILARIRRQMTARDSSSSTRDL